VLRVLSDHMDSVGTFEELLEIAGAAREHENESDRLQFLLTSAVDNLVGWRGLTETAANRAIDD
jgi:hypothetical protein